MDPDGPHMDADGPHVDADGPSERAGGECGAPMKRVLEVIDVWFDSGAMPFAQHHHPFEHEQEFEAQFPADFICEAQDQTRGWFYSLLAIATLLERGAPYRNVVCLGLILDPEGQKMSKSRGNVVEPWQVIDKYGADAFRWYFFTAKQPWDGYRFSAETIGEGVRLFLRQLWSTYFFYVLYAHANAQALQGVEGGRADEPTATGQEAGRSGHRPATEPRDDGAQAETPAQAGTLAVTPTPAEDPSTSAEDLPTFPEDPHTPVEDLDRWALSRTAATAELVAERLDAYDATSAGRAIAELVDELSNWYVRRSRRRFWDGDPAAFATLRTCLVSIAKLLAPFCPFIADEIYDNLDGTEASVHLSDFPAGEALPARDGELEEAMALAREVVRLGLSARKQAKIKVRQPLAEVTAAATGRQREAIERLQDAVREELNVKRVRFVAGAEELEVTLDETIDDDLRREGQAREIVRAVQRARKNAGLVVEDRIELRLDGDQALLDAAREHRDYLTAETLTLELGLDGGGEGTPSATDYAEQAKIDGLELTISLRRAAR
jgi:isoleucyl-tRNA synthetase